MPRGTVRARDHPWHARFVDVADNIQVEDLEAASRVFRSVLRRPSLIQALMIDPAFETAAKYLAGLGVREGDLVDEKETIEVDWRASRV